MDAVIIEDEALSRMYLNNLLQTWCSQIDVVAAAGNCGEAIAAIDHWLPGLIFLDIELFNSSGFDVVKMLGTHYPKIIFTTAMADSSLKIIKPSGLPFLQKPIDSDDLVATVEKIVVEDNGLHLLKVQALLHTLQNEHKPLSIYAEVYGGSSKFIAISEIMFIEAKGTQCRFWLVGSSVLHITNLSLKDCESFLCSSPFFRVSQTHIINALFAVSIDESIDTVVVMLNETRIPVSAKRTAEIKGVLGC